ncbi:MAG: glutathione S-transferase [Porticoccaceae bacterium]|nr:glutathione S-transferase [Porticoccaceae bacterium]MDG1312469.1 glutathione S-transferase [Porticoccaceae bacterium]
MAEASAYSSKNMLALEALTDVSCQLAPQVGVHLFHFPLSLCSMKVRQALAENGVQWKSHPILLPAYQQYEPNYVRINPRCVVPTLVCDGKVTTDSANILHFINFQLSTIDPSQKPSDNEFKVVNLWLDKADSLPIEAVTYGDDRGEKKSLIFKKLANGGKDHESKANLLRKLVKRYQNEKLLKDAYESKLRIVEATRGIIQTPAHMNALNDTIDAALIELETQLFAGPFNENGWLASKNFSLADIVWGVVLYRLQKLGLEPLLWSKRTIITQYCEKLFTRESFKSGILDWDNLPKHVILPMIKHKLFSRIKSDN